MSPRFAMPQLPIPLGDNLQTGQPFVLSPEVFETHAHLIGATGTGKTTLLEVILRGLFLNGGPRSSFFIIDPFGGFAKRLLRFIASRRYCPQSVRDRVVYLEPANTDYTTVIHPLRFDSRPQQDFQVARAMDLLLRGFDSQDVGAMPRLRRFLHQSLFDISQLGLPLSFLKFLLTPGTPEHTHLLARLPGDSQAIWRDLIQRHGNKALEYLDSTRNRVALFSDSIVLERMFSAAENIFDVPRFIREGKIVIVNLTPGKERKIHWHIAKTIGSMLVNEVLNEGISVMAQDDARPDVYLALDEFQRFLGPDIFDFLPVVRQMGIHLLLAHQSFSQLVSGDLDLRPMIAQARTRFMFANDFEDANLLADEIASLKWNPDEIKHQLQSHRQRLVGHRIEILRGGGRSKGTVSSASVQQSRGSSSGHTKVPGIWIPTTNEGESITWADVTGSANTDTESENWRQQLVPIHEDFYETTGVQFRQRDEIEHRWRQKLSGCKQGVCYAKVVSDPALHHLAVDYLEVGADSRSDDELAALLEQNYKSGPFISGPDADRGIERLRGELIQGPVIRLPGNGEPQSDPRREVFDD